MKSFYCVCELYCGGVCKQCTSEAPSCRADVINHVSCYVTPRCHASRYPRQHARPPYESPCEGKCAAPHICTLPPNVQDEHCCFSTATKADMCEICLSEEAGLSYLKHSPNIYQSSQAVSVRLGVQFISTTLNQNQLWTKLRGTMYKCSQCQIPDAAVMHTHNLCKVGNRSAMASHEIARQHWSI